ncbi:hypothetical protein IMX26_08390 [Clostridium sp. 'deep sea']|uniref:hypothetical protein n=1 Tax=Clostridium sp. 'deep sea' TaxID=2779445 RepID=UPI001896934C|nr:hypothetical protein [Clostridium sp. 'deep sea']QOR36813.1 hypothetical protein IMX26_08390 [Clostridium sp. 'deep sea']
MPKNKKLGIVYNRKRRLASVANINWSNYHNKWLLLKNMNGYWRFGRLKNHNPTTKTLTLFALRNGSFGNIVIPQANQTEVWLVERWSQIKP